MQQLRVWNFRENGMDGRSSGNQQGLGPLPGATPMNFPGEQTNRTCNDGLSHYFPCLLPISSLLETESSNVIWQRRGRWLPNLYSTIFRHVPFNYRSDAFVVVDFCKNVP